MKSTFEERVILHVDINNCYASIECRMNPSLKGKAVAVSGSIEDRHGIILAKNELAKKMGVKTGEAIFEAKAKCPGLILCEPHYDLYLKFSKAARKIYSDYTDRIEPFGIDEAWLDITGLYRNGKQADGEEIANEIRKRVFKELGITVSVGVSFNKIFAKLGSDLKKPDAVTVISRENYKQKVWELDCGELLYVGRKTKALLRRRGILTIGDLANADDKMLQCALGVNGLKLKRFARGEDKSKVALDGETAAVKSVGNSTTSPRDLCNDTDVKIVLNALSESVATRLRELNVKSGVITVSVRNKLLCVYSKQRHTDLFTNDAKDIADFAFSLYKESLPKANNQPIRSIGISAGDLRSENACEQLTLFESIEQSEKKERLNNAVDILREKYGYSCVRRGIILIDDYFKDFSTQIQNEVHPVSFMKSM